MAKADPPVASADVASAAPAATETAAQVPAASADVASDATTAEMPSMPRFKLTHDADSMEIDAVDEIAARAFFNDRRAKWPSPREVTCERL